MMSSITELCEFQSLLTFQSHQHCISTDRIQDPQTSSSETCRLLPVLEEDTSAIRSKRGVIGHVPDPFPRTFSSPARRIVSLRFQYYSAQRFLEAIVGLGRREQEEVLRPVRPPYQCNSFPIRAEFWTCGEVLHVCTTWDRITPEVVFNIPKPNRPVQT